MISYYIQPGQRGWYVMRDGEPTARFMHAHAAIEMAERLAARAARHGEEAVFTGISTEMLERAQRAA